MRRVADVRLGPPRPDEGMHEPGLFHRSEPGSVVGEISEVDPVEVLGDVAPSPDLPKPRGLDGPAVVAPVVRVLPILGPLERIDAENDVFDPDRARDLPRPVDLPTGDRGPLQGHGERLRLERLPRERGDEGRIDAARHRDERRTSGRDARDDLSLRALRCGGLGWGAVHREGGAKGRERHTVCPAKSP